MLVKFALLLAMLATAIFAIPAAAHDVLINIEPADKSQITESEFEATLVFNNPLLAIAGESNAELATKLVGETQWVSHEISIVGAVLKAKISLSQPGSYDLRWKVVSSDGHPISGESSFIAEFENLAQSAEPLVVSKPASQSTGGSLTGFYIGLAMVALGAVFAPIGMMVRRKARKS
jgi:methionine-rich copper-binding protein CopC